MKTLCVSDTMKYKIEVLNDRYSIK